MNLSVCLSAYGAVCQYKFVGTGINHGRIRHESVFPRKHFYGQHGKYGLKIAFTTCNYSVVIQQGKAKQPVVSIWSISLKQLSVSASRFSSSHTS